MVNNNELADFISRVPDNEELVSWLPQIIFVLERKADDQIFQKNFREISASDDIDKKTLAKMKKNAARDADII